MTIIARYARRVIVLGGFTGLLVLGVLSVTVPARAITAIPTPEPMPGSYGLAATKVQEPPTQAPTITSPGSGGSQTNQSVTVAGICQTDLLVQVYNNGVMVGSVLCQNNSFSLPVSLFAGTNELTAVMYDSLEQAGPTSNIVTLTYTDTRFTAFGQLVTLTSSYGRRSAVTGAELSWPLQLIGGIGPYAFSVSWGDGGDSELKSQSLAGVVAVAHTYKKAGIYQVNVRVADANGVSAFLQLVAVSSGKVDASTAGADTVNNGKVVTRTVILWLPAVIAVLLLIPAFWLGRRSQIVSLHAKMLKERDSYQQDQQK